MTTAITTRVAIAPDDPRHGSVAGRVAGCGCLPCRLAGNAWKVRRQRQIGYGTWQPWVDAEPVRAHLHRLKAYGIGWKTVAEITGVPESTVAGLLYTRGKNHTKPSAKCRPTTAEAILALKPSVDLVKDHAAIDGTGTVRRLRALVALGHSMQDLAARLPLHQEATRRVIRGGTDGVSGLLARATRDLYEELSTVRPDGPFSDRTRRMAASRGWVPPLAWDEGTIDDPDAKPNLGDTAAQADTYDPTTVAFAVEGRLTYDQIKGHRPDLIETVRRLARTLGDHEIARHLHWPGADENRDGSKRNRGQNTVCNFRKRNDIPGPEKYEAVYAYGTRSRARTTKAA